MAEAKTISLLCPVRGRPAYLISHFESIVETARQPGRLELVFYVDRDDPELSNYEKTFDLLRQACGNSGPKIVAVAGDRVGTPRAINAMAALSTGQLLMISNDDLVFVHPMWDEEIDRAAEPYPDGIFNIFFNDGYFEEKLSCFPIVGRQWYEALGYLAPLVFEHFVVDLWIHHLGKFTHRNLYLAHVAIEHRHVANPQSGIRFEWELEGPAQRRMERDTAYFQIFERYLRMDADLLKDVIAGKPVRYRLPPEAAATLLKYI